MTDTNPPPPTPLTDQAMAKLHKLAEGNNVAPGAIKLLGTEEQTYTLKGVMKLEPSVETTSTHHVGAARGKNMQIFKSLSALQGEVKQRSESMKQKHDWIPDALQQLKAQAGAGWGQNDVMIKLQVPPVVLAANEPCPKCRGQKFIPCDSCRGQGTATCNICNGSRYELCYGCFGRGVNPQQPDQPCVVCASQPSVVINGMRHIACRTCRGTGVIACPVCRGHRGMPCAPCKGTGIISEEITLTLIARTTFTLKGEGMPSGLRRTLDRMGIANLTKGHADITTIEPADMPEDEDLPISLPPPMPGENQPDDYGEQRVEKKGPSPEVYYEAKVPYADMRMDFAGKKALVGAFGKRCVLTSVPAFLDTALEPARAKLLAAATGKGSVEILTSTRVLHDALALQLGGKDNVIDLRRLYPYGLSPDTAKEILINMRRAVNRFTQMARGGIAVACAVMSALIFGGVFMTLVHAQLASMAPDIAIDAALLAAVMGLSWFALSSATGIALRKYFPDMTIPLKQKTGKTGYVMMSVITALFVGMVMLTPQKPGWMLALLHLLHR